MKRVFFYFPVIMFSMSLAAQDKQKEEQNGSAVLFQKVKRVTVQTAQGADGDESARSTSSAKLIKLGSHPVPAKEKWNSSQFYAGKNMQLATDDQPAMFLKSGNNFCSTPMVDESLEPVYASVKAHMPLYLPYKSSKVGIWQGFYYNWDKNNDGKKDLHSSIDYGKTSVDENEDPTFGVYAMAAGKVIDVKWSNGGGNIITIEHTAPNGYKYRSTYLHLRDGYDHDRAQAKNSPSDKYKKFASNGTASQLCWGTNNQKISVKIGDNVSNGQFLAYAGNTGSGGIGAILNDDGELTSPNTRSFNVHLHFEVRVKDTRTGHTNEWVTVDPYGTYNVAGVDCYDLDAETPFNRLFAPFYPSFHNVPLDMVNKFWGYYTGMGMALQTISVDKMGNSLFAAGSFQWGIPSAWYARVYMTGQKYQEYFNEYEKKGYRPRQISATKDGSGNPRFSVIWEKNPAGQSAFCVHGRNDANFNALWSEFVQAKKWQVTEHVDYTVEGVRYHAAVFVNKPNDNGFYLYYGLKGNDFDNKFKQLYNNWELKSIHVNGNTVGGVWRPKHYAYAAYYGMSSAEYQSKFNQFTNQGLRLIKVQNYDNNGRFSAIWGK